VLLIVSIVPDQPQNIGEMSYKNCVRLLTELAASIFYNLYCWPGSGLLVLPHVYKRQHLKVESNTFNQQGGSYQ
jgi:hypothetical protein